MASERIDAIADAWYRVIRPASSGRGDSAETREVARQLAERVVGLLSEEGGYGQHGIDALADRLLALQLSSQRLGGLQRELLQVLAADPPAAPEEGLQASASSLIGDLTATLLRRTEERVLQEQAEVQRGYAAALRQTEQQLHVMDVAVESSITAVALWTLNGEVTYVNPAFLAMWGYDDREKVLGRDASTLWKEDPPADAIEASVTRGGGWIGKLRAIHRDGSCFTVMLAASLVEPDGEMAPLVIGSFVDMTYREQLNAMLWRRVDRLKALRRVDQGILAAKSAQEIAQAALKHICQLIPCQGASVSVFRPSDERARFLAAIPQADYADEMADGMPLTGFDRVVSNLEANRMQIIEDVLALPLPTETRQSLERREAHSLAIVPLHCDGQLFGALNLVLKGRNELTERQVSIVREVADSLAVAIRQAQLNQAIADHREQLQDLTARLAEADEADRRRLARDLHDQIGQKLTALSVNLNVVKAHLDQDRSSEVVSRLDDSLQLIHQTSERVRGLIADLRPPMLDDYGLLPTLRWCGDQLEGRCEVTVTVRGEAPEPRLEPTVEDAIVRITQEALTNVLKHAEASRVTITLSEGEEMVRLRIADDGVGFSLDDEDQHGRDSWGLTTMRERAQAVGGSCCIESQPGEGTTVTVEVRR